jgi:anti-sigma B factor antagonist
MHMTTNTREVAGVTIVDISGRIVLGDESTELRDLVRLLLSMGHKAYSILPMSITSTERGHLVGAFTSVQNRREN